MKSLTTKWTLTDHVCRSCFGRVLQASRPERGGAFKFRCACCGAQDTGEAASVICSCGLTLEGKKDMGVRCQHNEARSAVARDEIVARVQVAGS